MKKYMRLEGVLPSLVSNPWGNDPQNYVGLKKLAWAYGKAPTSPAERYEPCAKVYEYHPSLVKAVGNGTLKQHGGTFVSSSLFEASKKGNG